MKPHLCLGTAQFGLAYGITNATGKVTEQEVSRILAVADVAGIQFLDCAQAYGDAEAVLGRAACKNYHFRIISKLQAQSSEAFTPHDVSKWDNLFSQSCLDLGVQALDALLLHSPADLRKLGGNLLEEWLLDLRGRGFVKRLGVSIYCKEDLESINPDILDIVQLPLSLYDQRLIEDGTIGGLRAKGVAIHARSLYLQGLLLTPPASLPNWINTSFLQHHKQLEAFAEEHKTTLLDLALSFAKQQTCLEAVVIGCCNVNELKELLTAWESRDYLQGHDLSRWAVHDPLMLDPRSWTC